MNYIAFTSYHTVVIKSLYEREEKSLIKFLAIMNQNIKNRDYDISYDSKKVLFDIVYDGNPYQVILPTETRTSIILGKPDKLSLELFKLVKKKKNYNDVMKAKADQVNKIKEIETSGYSKLIDIEDYALYLDYLNNKSQKTKSNDEKQLILAKIRGILKELTNPYNLKLHFNRFICDLANKGKIELDEDKKVELEAILAKITDDYYSIVSNDTEMLSLGSSTKPMSIVRRIEEVEHMVETWLTSGNTLKAKLVERDFTIVDDKSNDDLELDEVSQRLHNIMNGGGARK